MTAASGRERGDAALARLAARYVWRLPVDAVLHEPLLLLWSVLTTGTAEDYVTVRDRFGEAALVDALERALPGSVDDQSWYFWRRRFGLPETPPQRRRFE